ncbi:hypothetical protein M409DRAFT_16704 [Zasmidium cellare ATCC 36951]|uniref:Spindle pole body component n=1 Tax=Zasmidium cellare ATCC 36951 TaxID=1080233 RepID=A0A6A6D040_ZASCE|nr:uncharacterized protein M409DRAFT_16704 [Zasmidium cellare ATCC 36951]KAF2172741.1 hypothetical protein M409DRAFT_16704 [Zasmidium cellare ATCC 36951]
MIMAHAATLKKLAASLVTATTGRNPEEPLFGKLVDKTLKDLKNQSHARTNQFAVQAKLEGLVEKFTVLNRDDLAIALETDLEDLPQDSRWMPEILSLLLELSDHPVERTPAEDLDSEFATAEEPLTWEDIVDDEPFDDPDMWEDVERGYHSSGDDEFNHDLESEPTTSTKATSLDEEDPAAIARLYLSRPDEASIEHIKLARERGKSIKQQDTMHHLSELKIAREILSMMHGLPTDLFEIDDAGQVTVASEVRIGNASGDSLRDLLETAAATGSALNSLRQWVPEASHSYLQAIHGAIESQISYLDTQLGMMERRYITPTEHVAVSALNVETEIQAIARPLVHLSGIVQHTSCQDDLEAPFALLDELYSETDLAHLAGDMILFNALATVFLAGLRSYLRPVARWVTKGVIVPQDRDVLFSKDLNQHCEAGDLWRLRFGIRLLPDGTAFAPFCISTRTTSLFALGKSRAFLNQLDGNEACEDVQTMVQLPEFDHCLKQIADESLAPFSLLLDETLDSWIHDISVDCSASLRSKLFDDHHLKKTLDALPLLFFSHNGTLFQDFADTIISRVRTGRQSDTHDLFLRAELAQTTFGSSPDVDAENVCLASIGEEDVPSASSTTRRIGQLTMTYRLSWPVQNVVQSATIDAHSKVFTFLLQLHAATGLLEDNFLGFRSRNPVSPALLKLRQRLLWFSKSIFDYTTKTAHIIHKDMMQGIGRAADIDEMVAILARYEKRLQSNLLLAANLEPVRDTIIGILELSELLSKTDKEDRISSLQQQYEKSMRFLVAGIRGVGRAGGDSFLQGLSERLGWGV